MSQRNRHYSGTGNNYPTSHSHRNSAAFSHSGNQHRQRGGFRGGFFQSQTVHHHQQQYRRIDISVEDEVGRRRRHSDDDDDEHDNTDTRERRPAARRRVEAIPSQTAPPPPATNTRPTVTREHRPPSIAPPGSGSSGFLSPGPSVPVEKLEDKIAGVVSRRCFLKELDALFPAAKDPNWRQLVQDIKKHPLTDEAYISFALEHTFPQLQREVCVFQGVDTKWLVEDEKTPPEVLMNKVFFDQHPHLSAEMFPIATSPFRFPYRAIAFVLHNAANIHTSVAVMFLPLGQNPQGRVPLYHFDSLEIVPENEAEIARRKAAGIPNQRGNDSIARKLVAGIERNKLLSPADGRCQIELVTVEGWGPQDGLSCTSWCLAALGLVEDALASSSYHMPSESVIASINNDAIMTLYRTVYESYCLFRQTVIKYYEKCAEFMILNGNAAVKIDKTQLQTIWRSTAGTRLAGQQLDDQQRRREEILMQTMPRLAALVKQSNYLIPLLSPLFVGMFIRESIVCDNGFACIASFDAASLVMQVQRRLAYLEQQNRRLRPGDEVQEDGSIKRASSSDLSGSAAASQSGPLARLGEYDGFYSVCVCTLEDEVAFITCFHAVNKDHGMSPLRIYTAKSLCGRDFELDASLVALTGCKSSDLDPAKLDSSTLALYNQLSSSFNEKKTAPLRAAVVELYRGFGYMQNKCTLSESVELVCTDKFVNYGTLLGIHFLRAFLADPFSFPTDNQTLARLLHPKPEQFRALMGWRYNQFVMSLAWNQKRAVLYEEYMKQPARNLVHKSHSLRATAQQQHNRGSIPIVIRLDEDEEDGAGSNGHEEDDEQTAAATSNLLEVQLHTRLTWSNAYMFGRTADMMDIHENHADLRRSFLKILADEGTTEAQKREALVKLYKSDDSQAIFSSCPQASLYEQYNTRLLSFMDNEEIDPPSAIQYRPAWYAHSADVFQLSPWQTDFEFFASNTGNKSLLAKIKSLPTVAKGDKNALMTTLGSHRPLADMVLKDYVFPIFIHDPLGRTVLLSVPRLCCPALLSGKATIYQLHALLQQHEPGTVRTFGAAVRRALLLEAGVVPRFYFSNLDMCLHLQLEERGFPLERVLQSGAAATTQPAFDVNKLILFTERIRDQKETKDDAIKQQEQLLEDKLDQMPATDVMLAYVLCYYRWRTYKF